MHSIDHRNDHITTVLIQCLNVEPDILKAVIGGIDPSKACDFLKICNDGIYNLHLFLLSIVQ